MRVALVAPPCLTVPPQGYGGIEQVVALLANGLSGRGHHGPWTAAARRYYALVDHRVELVAISHAQQEANRSVR